MATIPIKGEAAKAVIELARVRDERKALEKRESELKDIIMLTLAVGDTGTIRNAPVVAVKEMTRSGVDTKRLAKDLPEVFEAFQSVTTFARIDTL
jgi:predicted phage-related endonuclease